MGDATEDAQADTDCELTAHVAQLAEHVLGKDEVTRSIRVVGSISELDPIGALAAGGRPEHPISVLRNSVLEKE